MNTAGADSSPRGVPALSDLLTPGGSAAAARECVEIIRELLPICRSITGDGVRRTLEVVGRTAPLERHEVPSGTVVFDWEVPREWNVRDAWIADSDSRRLVDFRSNSLHLVSYSKPVRATLTRAELEPHLHSLPERPDWIPYRTSYYQDNWGFCLRHRDRERLGDGPFEVVIDSELAPGHLSYGECTLAGTTGSAGLIYTHTCHPALVNDNLTGIAVAAVLARAVEAGVRRLTWRFVFAPGTIGSLTWLATHEDALDSIRVGYVVGLLGDPGPFTYKRSRDGSSLADRIACHVFEASEERSRIVEFEPYGYDERQFCSPGIDLPVGRLTRSPNGAYPEYHTSADDLSLVSEDRIAAALRVLARMIHVADRNRRLINLSPRGEPRLGKRGLFRPTGGTTPGEFEHALLWVLNQSDGSKDLLEIAGRSGLQFDLIDDAALALERVGLVTEAVAGERIRR